MDWEMMVLLPKWNWEYRFIWLVEFLWKVCSVVVNSCLKRSVMLHDALHGFREEWWMGTDTLEDNLTHQLARLAQKPLFLVLLDVCKAYDLLDRGWCLEIIRGYRLGPNQSRLPNNYWKR